MNYFYLSFLLVISTLLYANEPILPLPQKISLNPDKVALGKDLFFDTALSKDNTISCATCHNIADGGDDGLIHSFGILGKEGNINSPTVLNAVFNFRQFWDGRAKDLQDQAQGPIQNPVEMGYNFPDLIKRLQTTPYKKRFKQIYPDGITKENITDAIAEYEKTLITPSPFDRYLRGEKNAISKEAQEGYEIFKTKGCIACHQGINIGGNMYNRFGIYQDSNSSDLGLYKRTHKLRDKYFFKVPTLRNVALTAPYFHDGRTSSLRVAIYKMAQYQLGRKITPDEVKKIEAFLHSLTGSVPKEALQ